jgi:hypothetical protein
MRTDPQRGDCWDVAQTPPKGDEPLDALTVLCVLKTCA